MKTAKDGLKNGVIMICNPAWGSFEAGSIFNQSSEQMTIDYQTSSGHSFYHRKMSDTATTKMTVDGRKSDQYVYNSFIFQKWDP